MPSYSPLLATDLKGRFAQISQLVVPRSDLRTKLWTGVSLKEDADRDRIEVVVEKAKPMPDLMMTDDKLLVASERFREALSSDESLEWWPLANHQNLRLYLLHCTVVEEVLDLKRSQLSWSLSNPDLLRAVGPVFVPKVPDRQLFRCRHFPYLILATETGRKAIDRQTLVGVKWGDFVNTELRFPFVDSQEKR